MRKTREELNMLAERLVLIKFEQVNEFEKTRDELRKKSKEELIDTILALTTVVFEGGI